MTEKLYYQDAYIKEFSATVISCEKTDRGYITVLDRTAFFPEEGGQSADTGFIGEARVKDAYEKELVIYHITDKPLEVGKVLECKLDFEDRFEKMQLHSAEHILCGIIHKLYGYENVGFHLGEDLVTFDIGGVMTRDQLDTVEQMANVAVYSNQKIETLFPSEKELSSYEYRSKLDLSENVRLVKIGDIDMCACCAPHVGYTGEIGTIKILDFMKHRGGTRITMTAGIRALFDYRVKYENILRISAALSVPQEETADGLSRYMTEVEALRSELKALKLKAAESLSDSYESTDNNAVVLLPELSSEEIRAFCNRYKERVGGYVVALSGEEENYKYIITKKDSELSSIVKDINKALLGRGGGRGEMVSGTFSTTLEKIKEYFK